MTFGGTATLEFWPDGTVHKQLGAENPWTQLPIAEPLQTITMIKGGTTKTIKVNGLGKIELIQ